MCSGAPVRGINIVIIASMTSTITLNHKLLALKLRIEYYRRLSRGKGGGVGEEGCKVVEPGVTGESLPPYALICLEVIMPV